MRLILLLSGLLFAGLGFGQGTENFDNLCTSSCSPSASSYSSRSWTGQDGSTWTATRSRTDQSINGASIAMNDDTADTYVQSGTVSNGVGNLTITTQRVFGGGSGTIEIVVNGMIQGTVPYSSSTQTNTINNINIAGDCVIRINNNQGGSNGGGADRVAIDDITWTAFAGGPTAPEVLTDDVTDLTTTSVTLNGIVDDNEDAVTSIVFKYGTTSGGPYTNINASPFALAANSGATAVSAALIGLTDCETYYFVVEAVNSIGTTTSDEASFVTVVNNYCDAEGTTTFETGITLVSLEGINNSTPSDKINGYEDFTCSQEATLEQGTSYELTVNVNTDGDFQVEAFAWIDFNQDGDFLDDGEEFDLGGADVGSDTQTSASPFQIDVPIQAILGTTRMRVAAKYDDDPSSCETDFDGEVEDYAIVITSATSLPSVSDIRVNEVDSDTPGTDVAEFVELFSGAANYSLDNHVLVFVNGSNRRPLSVFDLDGFSTDANGYFIVGNSGAPGSPEITMSNGALQNGPDGVAIYFGNSIDFPSTEEVFSMHIIDALAYGTSADTDLENVLGVTETISENENGNIETESIQRGSWFVAAPTPRASNILPISLLSFTAKANVQTTLLSFSTATEQNNSHFLIQRSNDGKEFETIGQVAGKGDSNQQVDYEYTDTKPLAGLSYYRLQQFDYDGTFAYYGPVAVRFGTLGEEPNIWPVPTRDRLQVELPIGSTEMWLLEIYDLNGRRLLQQQVEEKNTITSLDVSNFAAGSYYLSWTNGQQSGQQRFLKQ